MAGGRGAVTRERSHLVPEAKSRFCPASGVPALLLSALRSQGHAAAALADLAVGEPGPGYLAPPVQERPRRWGEHHSLASILSCPAPHMACLRAALPLVFTVEKIKV